MLKLVTILAVTASTAALAADPAVPDIRGTWKFEGDSIVIGGGKHHPAEAEPKAEGNKPHLSKFEGTLRITNQEGDRFWGTITSASFTEDFIGTFTGEGKRYVGVDSDGFLSGEMLGPGSGRYCYQHIEPTSRVAACGTLTRE